MLQNSGITVLSALILAGSANAGFNYSACTSATSASSVNRADATQVCVHLNGAVSAVFTPKVDEFSAVSLTGSNYAFPSGTGYVQAGVGWVDGLTNANLSCVNNVNPVFYITMDVTFQGVSSGSPRIYKKVTYDACGGTNTSIVDTVPIYTVIIGLDSGKASYIAWDDGCFFCASSGSDCIANSIDTSTWEPFSDSSLMSCRESVSTCYPSTVTTYTNTSSNASAANATASIFASSCDLKLFITWTGTDASGNYLSSSGKRFSRYRQYGTASAYQSAVNLAQDGLSTAISTIGLVDGVPGRLIPGSSDERRLSSSSSSHSVRGHKAQAGAVEGEFDQAEASSSRYVPTADGDVIDTQTGISAKRLASLEHVRVKV